MDHASVAATQGFRRLVEEVKVGQRPEAIRLRRRLRRDKEGQRSEIVGAQTCCARFSLPRVLGGLCVRKCFRIRLPQFYTPGV